MCLFLFILFCNSTFHHHVSATLPLCLLFPRWSLIPRLLQTEVPATQTDRQGPRGGGTDLGPAHRRGTNQAVARREGGFSRGFRTVFFFFTNQLPGGASRKMNYFILLSLFATVFAGNAPRLKFVVHGKQSWICRIFAFWSQVVKPHMRCRCFISRCQVCCRWWIKAWLNGCMDEWINTVS